MCRLSPPCARRAAENVIFSRVRSWRTCVICPFGPYQESDFDYLAVYVIPKDTWYIIPSDVATKRIAIRVCPGNPKNQYEGYREAWHLLRQSPLPNPPSAVTLHAVAEIPTLEPFLGRRPAIGWRSGSPLR